MLKKFCNTARNVSSFTVFSNLLVPEGTTSWPPSLPHQQRPFTFKVNKNWSLGSTQVFGKNYTTQKAICFLNWDTKSCNFPRTALLLLVIALCIWAMLWSPETTRGETRDAAWGAGGIVIVHMSLTTVIRDRFRLYRWCCLIKVTLVTYDMNVGSTKHHKFSPGTPVTSGSTTGHMRAGPNWASKDNSLISWKGYQVYVSVNLWGF